MKCNNNVMYLLVAKKKEVIIFLHQTRVGRKRMKFMNYHRLP